MLKKSIFCTMLAQTRSRRSNAEEHSRHHVVDEARMAKNRPRQRASKTSPEPFKYRELHGANA